MKSMRGYVRPYASRRVQTFLRRVKLNSFPQSIISKIVATKGAK